MNISTSYSSALRTMYQDLLGTQALSLQNMINLEALLERSRQQAKRAHALADFQLVR